MTKDLSNEEFDYFLGNGEKQSNIVQEYDKTAKQKLVENWESVKSRFEWGKLPSTLLILGIMTTGGILMYTSLIGFTGNFAISLISPVFGEAGILSWSASKNRSKNTKKQIEIAKFMRQWHIVVSVLMLVANLLVEASAKVLSLQFEGAGITIIFSLMGITAFLDIWNYYQFQDNDREASNKLDFARRQAELKAETTRIKMEALHETEIIRANAEVDFMRRYAPKLAQKVGEVSAAGNLSSAYKRIGLSKEEVSDLFNQVEQEDGTDYKNPQLAIPSQTSTQTNNPPQPRAKRPYVRHNRVDTPSTNNQEVETQEGNFQEGTDSKVETWE